MEEEKHKEDEIEELLNKIGPLGKYHLRFYLIAALSGLLGGNVFLGSSVLTSGAPQFECCTADLIINLVNQSCGGEWSAVQENLTVPWDEQNQAFDHCQRYILEPVVIPVECAYWFPNASAGVNETGKGFDLEIKKCSKWTYHHDILYETIESDFDLVCEDEWKSQFSNFMLMTGVLIGALISGFCNDRFGRKRTCVVGTFMVSLSALASSFTKTYWQYALVQMWIGSAYISISMSGYILAMEFCAARHRVVISVILMCSFSFSLMLLGLLGYLLRNWRTVLQIAVGPIFISAIIFWKYCFESSRWLHSKNRHDEADSILNRIAKISGHNIEEDGNEIDRSELLLYQTEEIGKRRHALIEVIKNTTLRKITLILCYNWFAITCVYYGLIFNSSSLAGNVFVNIFLSGLVEIPAHIGSFSLLHKCGRRHFLFLCHFVSGAALVSLGAVPNELVWLNTLLYLVGKFGVTAAFNGIYIFSSELYPTPVRGTGMGFCSSCARFGGMAAVPILMLAKVSFVLPYIVFGVAALLAGILIGLLPETKGSPLPETVEDCENMRKATSIKMFAKCYRSK